MKLTKIKKGSFYLLLALITISIVSCLGIKSQIKQHSGSNTERVNPSNFKIPSSVLAITNVSVLSKDCTQMLDSLTVLISKGKILSVSKSGNIPKGFKVVDGTGKYLIPGLMDTHVHLNDSKNDLLLYLANGVTYVSEMYGNKKHLKWRKEAREGGLSPQIYVATRKLASKKGFMHVVRSWFGANPNFRKTTKARKAIKKYKEQGYDGIKLSSFLEIKIYKAITDEAKKQNIPVIGHLSIDVGLNTLYTSGQSQLAHIEEITKNTMKNFGGLNYDNTSEYLEYLNKIKDDIAIKLRESNIAVSSTIWLMESLPKQKFDLDNFIKTIELEYVNPGFIEGSKMAKGWLPGNNSYENLEVKNNPKKNKKSQLFWKTYVEAVHIMTKALADNNATIIAGTDANTACTVPGFSLHDELESLSKSGLTNSEVLYAATVAPAEWMQSNSGKIATGYNADLVLLNSNPLKNIKHTKSIESVIVGGKLLDRKILDLMLRKVKEANNLSRKVDINKFE